MKTLPSSFAVDRRAIRAATIVAAGLVIQKLLEYAAAANLAGCKIVVISGNP
jgi:hypothetical protein